MTKPKSLFKYQPINQYSLRNLKNNHLYFNHPEDFNDPYDTFHDVEFSALSNDVAKNLCFKIKDYKVLFEKVENKSASKEEIKGLLSFLFKELKKFEIYFLAHLTSRYKADSNTNMQGFLDEIAIDDEFYDSITNSFYLSVNEIIKEEFFIAREAHLRNRGISCFSSTVDSMLMWAYYADGHKGFCLEFNTEYKPFSKIRKVKYKNSIPAIDSNTIVDPSNDLLTIIDACLFVKYRQWSHEREWRVLHEKNRTTYGYLPNALKAIYFGSKIPFTDLEIISLIIKGQHPKCKLYQMEKIPGQFKLIPKNIVYTTFQEAKEVVFKIIQSKLNIGVTNADDLIKGVNLPISESHLKTIVEAIIDDIKVEIEQR